MRFWDSSAIVPLLVQQPQTDQDNTLYKEDDNMILWWGTQIECDSALARLEREALLSPEGMTIALARLDALVGTYHEIEPSPEIRQIARRLLRTHVRRAADALQLAAARVAAEDDPGTLPLVCFDERLCRAAQREGFVVATSAAPRAT